MSRLQDEIRQTRPFGSREQEAHLGIARTAAALDHAVAEALKPYGLTPTQYNVLRILRGAGEEGLCRGAVRERMVAQVPDTTRLLDRMEAAGLIQRARDAVDRRFVTTRIAEPGLQLLERLEAPIDELHRAHFARLSPVEIEELNRLLELVRSGVD